MIAFPQIGCSVLTPDLDEGVLEEIDAGDGMARVRHIAWSGEPSCCSTWFADISVLKPLPIGWVRPTHTPDEWAKARAFWGLIEDALEGPAMTEEEVNDLFSR